MDFVSSGEGLQLSLAFMKIKDAKVRKRVLDSGQEPGGRRSQKSLGSSGATLSLPSPTEPLAIAAPHRHPAGVMPLAAHSTSR
jgi:hypothetical protein